MKCILMNKNTRVLSAEYHSSLGVFTDVYDIYDSYIECGNTFVDFIPVIMDIYKTSGLIKEDKKSTKKGKTSTEKN